MSALEIFSKIAISAAGVFMMAIIVFTNSQAQPRLESYASGVAAGALIVTVLAVFGVVWSW